MAIFKTSKKSSEKSSDKKSGGGIFDPSHDFVRFEDEDGKATIIPRGNLSDEAWKSLVTKATQKSTFKEARVGKDVVKAPSAGQEAPVAFEFGPSGEGRMVPNESQDPGVAFEFSKSGKGDRMVSTEPEPVIEPLEDPYPALRPEPAEPSIGAFEEPNVAKIGTEEGPPAHPVVKRLPDVPVQPYGIQAGGEEFRRSIGRAVDSGGQLAAEALGSPAAMGFMGGFQKGLAHPLDAARELGEAVFPSSPGAKLQGLVDAGKEGLPTPAELAKTPSGPPPASPTNTPSTSNSNSLSVSVRGGPGGSPPREASQLDQAMKDFQAGQEREQQDAFNTANAQLQAREEHARKMREFEVKQNEEKLSQRKAEDDLNNAYRSTLDELGKKMQLDPNHFWESKSTGQQVGIAIGAFLAGIGGRSPAALIDSMVQQDIAIQRENFNLAREGLKGKLAGLDNMYGKLRQRGLDDREAAAATRASINEGLALQMASIAEQSVPGVLQSKAQLALAEFRANKVRAEEELTTLRFNRWAKTQELQNQRIAFAMSAAQSAAKVKEKKDKVAATLLKEQMQFEDMLANVDAMVADASGGMFERGLTAAATALPGGGLVDPDRKAKGRDFAQRAFTRMTELAKSALQVHEYEILQGMVPKEITAYDNPIPTLMKMRDFIVKARDRRAEFYKGGGLPDTGPVQEEKDEGE